MCRNVTFFIDRNLGSRIVAQALVNAGENVQVHDEHFPMDAKDEEWIPVVCQRGWIILTKDSRIAYRQIRESRRMERCANIAPVAN